MSGLDILTYFVWLISAVTFIIALKFLASPPYGANRQPARRDRHGARGGLDLLHHRRHVGELVDHRRRRHRRLDRRPAGRETRPDDRHAADGRHLQWRRRWCRGPGRGRRVPPRYRLASRRAPAACLHHRHAARRGHRLGVAHRLGRGVGQAPGRCRLAAGEVPRLADRDGRPGRGAARHRCLSDGRGADGAALHAVRRPGADSRRAADDADRWRGHAGRRRRCSTATPASRSPRPASC